MKVKAIIFDLDGTLADTIDAIRGAINATMRQYGYPEKTYEDIRRVLGNGAKNLVRGCMPVEAAADAAQFPLYLWDTVYSRQRQKSRQSSNIRHNLDIILSSSLQQG